MSGPLTLLLVVAAGFALAALVDGAGSLIDRAAGRVSRAVRRRARRATSDERWAQAAARRGHHIDRSAR